ncbi:flavin-containing monooxygenase [Actinokineospora soli]|uniref:Flavin-containing monooxygenase n=1 Tax=Actinokineospora soli TaxID=1048753 RepID=A0ABW2TP06_9PSEU
MTEDDSTVDLAAVREKYRAERDKRTTGRRYRPARGDLARYAADPHAEPFERAPLTDTVDVAIVGGGIGGLLAGARLRESGAVETIRIFDPAADVGGTWYWNRFPGLRCDVESYIYMPLLEELGTVPTEKYATGAEISAHCQAIAREYDLYRDACLQTTVTGIAWDDSAGCWTIATDRGDRVRARFVCLAIGSLHRPKLPDLPGIDTFRGHSFHTSRWDFAYTGGDSSGGLVGLRGKRVAVIGTGATGVQVIPHLADWAEHLYVFQRTPPRSAPAATAPPTRTGPRAWNPAGSSAGWTTSTC